MRVCADAVPTTACVCNDSRSGEYIDPVADMRLRTRFPLKLQNREEKTVVRLFMAFTHINFTATNATFNYEFMISMKYNFSKQNRTFMKFSRHKMRQHTVTRPRCTFNYTHTLTLHYFQFQTHHTFTHTHGVLPSYMQ